MTQIVTLDGPLEITASDALLSEVEDALSFWYAYGRHPYRSLGGFKTFCITTSDFRYIDDAQYWRLTLDQTLEMLRALWPIQSADVLARLKNFK